MLEITQSTPKTPSYTRLHISDCPLVCSQHVFQKEPITSPQHAYFQYNCFETASAIPMQGFGADRKHLCTSDKVHTKPDFILYHKYKCRSTHM